MEYKIKELADFNKVPLERLDDCLEAFKMWINDNKEKIDYLYNLSEMLNTKMSYNEEFIWVSEV